MAGLAGEVCCGASVAVGASGVGAGIKQQPHQHQIAPGCGFHECGAALRVDRVDVVTPGYCLPRAGHITCLCGP